jgi:ketosteroid isomerase-like protein
MRYLSVTLVLFAAHVDRDTLLAADRSLSIHTAARGVLQGFVPSLTDGAAYLHPGAPLLRGSRDIREFLAADSAATISWTPLFADVSADGGLGYTYGWTQSRDARGKYLACWRRERGVWRIAAYARTGEVPVADSSVPAARRVEPAPPPAVRGRADAHELLGADSTFAAMSASHGVKAAFLEYAAEDAVTFGAGARLNEGRDAIGASFDDFPSGAVLEWWPVAAEIAGSGDLGCTVGEATIPTLKRYSKYLTIWKRQQDGSWKFVADGGNARPAPNP